MRVNHTKTIMVILVVLLIKEKSKVGEWWTRGNDLPDGKFNELTWNRIVNAIIGYEIKNLQIDTKLNK